MKKLTLFAILFLISTSFTVQDSAKDCSGKERWDVKTLTDPAVDKIDFKAKKTTILNLRTVSVDRKIGNAIPRFGLEFKTYTIQCHVREYRVEDDGDLHLVLVDLNDSSKTMIGEIPNTLCTVASKSKYINKMKPISEQFKKYILPHFKVQSGIYEITGVIFFDKIHGQLGVAPNGIELHPIVAFKKIK